MSEGVDSAQAAQWLGTAAVDGARVGPFELVSCDSREGATEAAFDVFVDGFDEPLAFGVSAADADSLTRRFIASVSGWDAKRRTLAPASYAPPPGSVRRSPSRRPSQHTSSRPKRRISRGAMLALFVGAVFALSAAAYYVGTSNAPDTTEPPPAP